MTRAVRVTWGSLDTGSPFAAHSHRADARRRSPNDLAGAWKGDCRAVSLGVPERIVNHFEYRIEFRLSGPIAEEMTRGGGRMTLNRDVGACAAGS